MLRREIWVEGRGRVVRYNLAYINHLIYTGDGGGVLGAGRHRSAGTDTAHSGATELVFLDDYVS